MCKYYETEKYSVYIDTRAEHKSTRNTNLLHILMVMLLLKYTYKPIIFTTKNLTPSTILLFSLCTHLMSCMHFVPISYPYLQYYFSFFFAVLN
ncbi:hypothetical protein Hanom_Chr11g00981161 [Helianthus anomalus]